MALTPDQKKRIADLDAKPAASEPKPAATAGLFLPKLNTLWLVLRTSRLRAAIGKSIFLCIALGMAIYFILTYQIHKLDFKAILSFRPGSPVTNFVRALQVQKEKADMLDKGQAQFMSGDYAAAFATAVAVQQIDPKDFRVQKLINLLADAATVRASRELDAGEIERALADVRLALIHRPDHKSASELSLRIAGQLLREAQTHYNKREYPQVIAKAQEVRKINPSDVVALNLLMRTNDELLGYADDLFMARRYFEALENVRQSLRIDPSGARARSLLRNISMYVETPDLRLRGIIKSDGIPHALIQLPQENAPRYVKEGEIIRNSRVNFRVIRIDSEAKTVALVQIHTKQEFTIGLPQPQ